MLHIRSATRHDLALILELIRALAEYEKLSDECVANEELLERTLFGERP
jgi:N-acetylglutamate synthase-like GNAT family acetyltransferase